MLHLIRTHTYTHFTLKILFWIKLSHNLHNLTKVLFVCPKNWICECVKGQKYKTFTECCVDTWCESLFGFHMNKYEENSCENIYFLVFLMEYFFFKYNLHNASLWRKKNNFFYCFYLSNIFIVNGIWQRKKFMNFFFKFY